MHEHTDTHKHMHGTKTKDRMRYILLFSKGYIKKIKGSVQAVVTEGKSFKSVIRSKIKMIRLH